MNFNSTVIKIRKKVKNKGYILGGDLFDLIVKKAPKSFSLDHMIEIWKDVADDKDFHKVIYMNKKHIDDIFYYNQEKKEK